MTTQNKCCAFPCAKFLIPLISSLTKPCHLVQPDTMTECSHLWKNNPHSDWPAERPSAVWLAKGGWKSKIRDKNKGMVGQHLRGPLICLFPCFLFSSSTPSSPLPVPFSVTSPTSCRPKQPEQWCSRGVKQFHLHTITTFKYCYVTTYFLSYPACTI